MRDVRDTTVHAVHSQPLTDLSRQRILVCTRDISVRQLRLAKSGQPRDIRDLYPCGVLLGPTAHAREHLNFVQRAMRQKIDLGIDIVDGIDYPVGTFQEV